MTTFKHSGDIGDIIYALPAIKAIGGGDLLLDINGGADCEAVQQSIAPFGYKRLRFNEESYEFVEPLLKQQSYINSVQRWHGQKFDVDLDAWRAIRVAPDVHLADRVQDLCRVVVDLHAPWLSVGHYEDHKRLVVSRNLRYTAYLEFWESHRGVLDKARFIGTKMEYDVFCSLFLVEPEYAKVENALDIARIIAGSCEFWGNQCLPMAIAEGIGKQFVQEVYPPAANCVLPRRGKYVYTEQYYEHDRS